MEIDRQLNSDWLLLLCWCASHVKKVLLCFCDR